MLCDFLFPSFCSCIFYISVFYIILFYLLSFYPIILLSFYLVILLSCYPVISFCLYFSSIFSISLFRCIFLVFIFAFYCSYFFLLFFRLSRKYLDDSPDSLIHMHLMIRYFPMFSFVDCDQAYFYFRFFD